MAEEETRLLNAALFEALIEEPATKDALNTFTVDMMRRGGIGTMVRAALERPETPLEREIRLGRPR